MEFMKNCGRIVFQEFLSTKTQMAMKFYKNCSKKSCSAAPAFSLEIPNISYDSYNTINISRKQILSASDKNMYSDYKGAFTYDVRCFWAFLT